MCSFICTTKEFNELTNLKSAYRGPDHSEKCSVNGFNIIHNLLDISQHNLVQPVIDGDIILLYNGEIYDPGDPCDTNLIIPLYKKYGHSFVEHLNGEYAIAIIDKQNVFLYADVFATKPLFYSINGDDIGIASYASELVNLKFTNIIRVESSTYIQIKLSDFSITKFKHNSFDLTEYKTSYDDCILALENACNLRCNDKAAVGLSSGHDSGSILQWCLDNTTNNKFYYIHTGEEDADVMEHRLNLCDCNNILHKTINYYDNCAVYDYYEKHILSNKMEEYEYYLSVDGRSTLMLSKMLRTAKRHGYNIYIAGQGVDEIISNYEDPGDPPFFTNLQLQFPWKNFFNGLNREFIDQYEYIGGAYGVEVRYPFLDKVFIQEFLHLTKEMKNKFYKSVVTEYLNRNNMPAKNTKVGLNIYNANWLKQVSTS